MPEALILEFTGVTEAEYAAVNKHLGIDMHTGQGDWPAGLLSHAGGTADDGTFIVAAGIGLGVLWGAIFGFVAHLATRGERDFSSLRGLSAARYDLIAREGGAERARAALDRAGLLPAEAAQTPLS